MRASLQAYQVGTDKNHCSSQSNEKLHHAPSFRLTLVIQFQPALKQERSAGVTISTEHHDS